MNQIGVIQGIEHKTGVWSDRLTETETDLSAQEAIISSPFAKQAELDAKTSRFNEVMSILNPKDEQVIGDEGDVQYQARENSQPHKYSYDWFASKPDMIVTEISGTAPTNRADIVYQAKQNAASVGKTNKDGVPVVHVLDTDTDVMVSKKSLVHGLDRRMSVQAPVLVKIGEVLKNSIRINELNPRRTDISNTYVLVGAAKSADGYYVASFVVNRFSNEVAEIDVLYSANAKKEPAALLPKFTDKSATPTGSVISIVDLLDIVNELFPDILPEDVLKHYGHKARPEGIIGNDALYQQRTSPLTDREVLSIAASEVNVEGLTDGERDALNIFKRRLDNLNELEQKRAEEGRKYKEQQFGANIDRAEAQKTLNRMKILDDQIKRASSEVLDVEKKEVLKRVLQRSRKVVEKAEREHGQELLRRYRDRRNNSAAIKKYRDRIAALGEHRGQSGKQCRAQRKKNPHENALLYCFHYYTGV